jgi:CBS domain-containing protein
MVPMSEPVLAADATLRDAVRALEESRRFIAVVVDAGGKLLGTVSDGDVRRAILAGRELSDLVIDSMAENPVTVPHDMDPPAVQAFIHQTRIAAVPVVDSEGRFLRIEHDHALYTGGSSPQSCAGYGAAVIMAGGEGRRLRPLTETLPKPMI